MATASDPDFMQLTAAEKDIIRVQNRHLTLGFIACGLLVVACIVLGVKLTASSLPLGLVAILLGIGAAIWAADRVIVHAATPYRKQITEPHRDAAVQWLVQRYNVGLDPYDMFELLLGKEGKWECPQASWAGTERHHGTIYPPGQPDGLRLTYSAEGGYRVVNAQTGTELPRWDLVH